MRGGIEGLDTARAELAAGRPALIWRRQLADTDTPVAAALKLIEPGRGDFLLESVEGGAVRGRHSMIGLAPDLVFRAQGQAAEVNSNWLTDRDAFVPADAPTLDAFRALVQSCRIDVPAELPRALACLVGYFGYETVGLVETLPRPAENPIGVPDMMFVRPTVVLIFDRLADALFLVAPVWPDAARDADSLIADAAERIEMLTDSLETMQVSHVFLARSPAGAQTAAKAHKEPRTIRKKALCSVKEACCRGTSRSTDRGEGA